MIVEIVLISATVICYIYWKWAQIYTHWSRLGVPHVKGQFPFGSLSTIYCRKKHPIELDREHYNLFYDEPFYGVYDIRSPVLVVKDPELIRSILVRDFDHFVNRKSLLSIRGLPKDRLTQVWVKLLVNLRNNEWRRARSVASPVFTSGKLKAMMKLMESVADEMLAYVENASDTGAMIELKDTFGKFSLDVIASCSFGIDLESFRKDESLFATYVSAIFQRSMRDMLRFFVMKIPMGTYIFQHFKIPVFKGKETKFFLDVVESTLAMRRQSKVRRNDLIDILDDFLKEQENNTSDEPCLDQLTVVAIAIVFLVAGYDNTGQILAYAGYELAMNPECQEKLQREIDEAFGSAEGAHLDYHTILNLPYLDNVLSEVLRLHPTLSHLDRVCTKDYQIPGTDLTIREDDTVFINVTGVHLDSRFYPQPEKFLPERFGKDNIDKLTPYTYLPFGDGPRNCIGMRFALLESKIALASLVRKFTFDTCEKTVREIVPDPTQILGANKGGLWVRIGRRQSNPS